MKDRLKRFWNAWRGVLEHEETRWREETGEESREGAEETGCATPEQAPTLSELVAKRQAEIRPDDYGR